MSSQLPPSASSREVEDPDPPDWRPSGLVSLISDFGHEDPYVGIMKGVLHRTQPGLTLVDLTHAVPPQDVRRAAWFLMSAWRWFPEGTVHVAVVDPGVGSERRILCALDRGHAFLAPDNGLLGPVLSAQARVCELDVERFGAARISRTFHGRDVFAPAAGQIASGLEPTRTGRAVGEWSKLSFPGPVRIASESAAGDDIQGVVLYADHFGNLITNIRGEDLGMSRPGVLVGEAARSLAVLEIRGRRVPLRETYAEVSSGELVALINSFEALEVAVRDGSASRELGAGPGDVLTLRRQV